MKINSGTILLAFFAVVAGLIGVHFYREANRPKPVVAQPQVAKKAQPRAMVVPMVSRTLRPGQTITKDDVALVKLTKAQMEENGLNKAFMSKADQIIGKTVKRELRRGNTFDTRDFYPVGQGPGIVGRVKPGQRAITIDMLPTNALLGFAGAGQSVDVLFHYGQQEEYSNNNPLTPGSNRPQRRNRNSDIPMALRAATSTLIQGAEILAFNQQTIAVDETRGLPMDRRVLVTLSVFPQEAELLRMASGHGELSLTLRSPADKENVPTVTPRTLDEIIDVRSTRQQMEIYRGSRVSRLEFQGGTVIKRTINSGKRNQLVGSGSGTKKNAILPSQTTKVDTPKSESAKSETMSDYREIPQTEIEDGDPFLTPSNSGQGDQ